MLKRHAGIFITFEGVEGSGKTTLINYIFETLNHEGYPVIQTEEPGGTSVGKEIKNFLLGTKGKTVPYTKRCEFFLFLAARAEHVTKVILPALKEGKTVLCDRFNDSTLAYMEIAKEIGAIEMEECCSLATFSVVPDLTFLLDLDPKIGLKRARLGGNLDLIERRPLSFHEGVRESYLQLARKNPSRFRVLNAEQREIPVYKNAILEIRKAIIP